MKKKLKWFIDNFEDATSAAFLAAVIILLFMQVILRYVFGKSLAWTEELSRFCFIYMVYLSASLAAKTRTHIRVTAQFKLLPKKLKKYFILFADAVWVVFCLIVINEGFKLVFKMKEHPLISPVLDLNLMWIFLIIPLSFILQVIRIIQADYLALKHGLDLVVEEGEGVENVT